MNKSIEFWFDFGSNYSYLNALRIEALAARHGAQVLWRPFLLGPIFKAFGWDTSPFLLQKEKGEYMWRDMARQCRKYGLPWKPPCVFPCSSLLAARVALAAGEAPWLPEYCRRIFLLNFAEDRDLDEPNVAAVLSQLAVPPNVLLEIAKSEAVKLALRERTAQARERRIFGAPTFFAGSEMFWGNDRLEDALQEIA
jgi:2-hydroxychromene-2-carboxylate isomerase